MKVRSRLFRYPLELLREKVKPLSLLPPVSGIASGLYVLRKKVFRDKKRGRKEARQLEGWVAVFLIRVGKRQHSF